MSAWVLVLIFCNFQGKAIDHIEFLTNISCQKATTEISSSTGGEVYTFCIERPNK